eukprot:GHVL01021493.1.p2 GENE.GHVL01021493.1~~GHVL01021493.1.p2  ORF type:complete len:307 (-),score=81.40 GHVL01021493.1:62-982(-)
MNFPHFFSPNIMDNVLLNSFNNENNFLFQNQSLQQLFNNCALFNPNMNDGTIMQNFIIPPTEPRDQYSAFSPTQTTPEAGCDTHHRTWKKRRKFQSDEGECHPIVQPDKAHCGDGLYTKPEESSNYIPQSDASILGTPQGAPQIALQINHQNATNDSFYTYPDSVTTNSVTADSVTANSVTADSVTADSATADSATADSVTADSLTADSVAANSVTADSVTADSVTARKSLSDVLERAAANVGMTSNQVETLHLQLQDQFITTPDQLAQVNDFQWSLMNLPLGFLNEIRQHLWNENRFNSEDRNCK